MHKVAVIGYGHVGSLVQKLFGDAAYIYDEPKGIGNRDTVNRCEYAFVCVPTPMGFDGRCNVTIVNSVLKWLETPIIVIRSTVPVGYTMLVSGILDKHIVFQPEYYGETIAHPFEDPHNRPWITLGGDLEDTTKVANLYKSVFTSEIFINKVDSKTAELAKYMENCFLATKVAFCNEFYDLAIKMGVDYDILRETWLLDPRIGRSHTFVYEDDRGFGGSCLPKDTAATVYQAKKFGLDMTMLKGVIQSNKEIRGEEI